MMDNKDGDTDTLQSNDGESKEEEVEEVSSTSFSAAMYQTWWLMSQNVDVTGTLKDPVSIAAKIIFRRGQAWMALDNYSYALKDLGRAARLQPKNKLIRKQLKLAKSKIDREKERQKKALKSVFG